MKNKTIPHFCSSFEDPIILTKEIIVLIKTIPINHSSIKKNLNRIVKKNNKKNPHSKETKKVNKKTIKIFLIIKKKNFSLFLSHILFFLSPIKPTL